MKRREGERAVFIDESTGRTFRSMRRLFLKLTPKGRERFRRLFIFACNSMEVELHRAPGRRKAGRPE